MAKKLGQGIEFNISGNFMLHITDIFGKKVEEDIEKGIQDNLAQGEYVIDIRNRHILDINDLQKPIYLFSLEPTCSSEYDWEPLL